MAMTLGYWDIRGLAHAIRLLLEYTGCNYVEKLYSMGDAPDYDRSQWLDEKFKLGLDFPNLPYLIDGAHRLTQSNAILRYIARKHNLCGETEEEKICVDILVNQAMDTSNELATVCYSPDFEKLKPEYLKKIPETMTLYSKFLGKKPWFAGDKLTFVDFLVYDILDLHRIFEPKCLDAFTNLKDFVTRVEILTWSRPAAVKFLFTAPSGSPAPAVSIFSLKRFSSVLLLIHSADQSWRFHEGWDGEHRA